MNLADLAIRNKTTTLVLSAVFFLGGITSFNNLPRLEDPEFTIKEALVITPYPGATAVEVETEVSDKIEKAVQQLGQLKEVESSVMNAQKFALLESHRKGLLSEEVLNAQLKEINEKLYRTRQDG